MAGSLKYGVLESPRNPRRLPNDPAPPESTWRFAMVALRFSSVRVVVGAVGSSWASLASVASQGLQGGCSRLVWMRTDSRGSAKASVLTKTLRKTRRGLRVAFVRSRGVMVTGAALSRGHG